MSPIHDVNRSRALVPVSTLQKATEQQARSRSNTVAPAHRSSRDSVSLSETSLSVPVQQASTSFKTVHLQDTPRTRDQVRAHYGSSQTAPTLYASTPPGSRLSIRA